VAIVDFRTALLGTSIITSSHETRGAFINSFETGANNKTKINVNNENVTEMVRLLYY